MRKLERAAARFEKAQKEQDIQKLNKLNMNYHDIIYKASESKMLYDLIYHLRSYFYRYRRVLLDLPEMAAISSMEHKAVVYAMRSRDADMAEELARRHILRGGRVLLQAIKERKIEL